MATQTPIMLTVAANPSVLPERAMTTDEIRTTENLIDWLQRLNRELPRRHPLDSQRMIGRMVLADLLWLHGQATGKVAEHCGQALRHLEPVADIGANIGDGLDYDDRARCNAVITRALCQAYISLKQVMNLCTPAIAA